MSESTAVVRLEAKAALVSLPVAERATIRRQALEELQQIVVAQAALAQDVYAKGSTSAARFVAEMAGMLRSGAIPRDIVGEKLVATKEHFYGILVRELGEERAGAVWNAEYEKFRTIWGDV